MKNFVAALVMFCLLSVCSLAEAGGDKVVVRRGLFGRRSVSVNVAPQRAVVSPLLVQQQRVRVAQQVIVQPQRVLVAPQSSVRVLGNSTVIRSGGVTFLRSGSQIILIH